MSQGCTLNPGAVSLLNLEAYKAMLYFLKSEAKHWPFLYILNLICCSAPTPHLWYRSFLWGLLHANKGNKIILDHKGNDIVKGTVDFAFNVYANGDVSTEYTTNSNK
jgi:hypothetical protein